MSDALFIAVISFIEFLVTHVKEEEEVMQDIQLAIANHKERLNAKSK